MSIHFQCGDCQQKLHIGDEFAGMLVACPNCSAKLRVPRPEPEYEAPAMTFATAEIPEYRPDSAESFATTTAPTDSRLDLQETEPAATIRFDTLDSGEISQLQREEATTRSPQPQEALDDLVEIDDPSADDVPIVSSPVAPRSASMTGTPPTASDGTIADGTIADGTIADGTIADGERLLRPASLPETLVEEATAPPIDLRPDPVVAVADEPERQHAGRHEEDDYVPLSKPGASHNPAELIDMTAMVDIVFFLLIFFLVTSMQSLNSTIPMPHPDPQAAGSGSQPAEELEKLESDDEYVTVNIDRANTVHVGGVQVEGPDELMLKIRQLREEPPHPRKMLVIGHGEGTHGKMVEVLDAGYDAGMESIRMAIGEKADE